MLRAVGEQCRRFTGKVNFADMPGLFKAAASLEDPNGFATTLLDLNHGGEKAGALELAK